MPAPGQSFRATIHKKGVNPYVEIPERVSRAFAEHAKAGQIRVLGTLNQTPIQATLVPIGGHHRLYINGGMRSAAGVEVGDRVRIELKPAAPEQVEVPKDLLEVLAGAGASRAFNALKASHRRELLRYINDARTVSARRKRIAEAIESVQGKPARVRTHPRQLWVCPKCGNEFVNRNQYHACARYTVDQVFAGKPEKIRKLFEKFRKMVKRCGPVKELAYRDRVGYMVQVRFAGARPYREWLDVGFWLRRRLDHPRFRKVETITPNAQVHVMRIHELRQLDGEIAELLREAYAAGCQR